MPVEYPPEATAKLPPIGVADKERGSRSCAIESLTKRQAINAIKVISFIVIVLNQKLLTCK